MACEYSGVVRDAFAARGHYAMSCDLLPTDAPGPHHQGDVFDVIGHGWDLMIAHPPCTYLAKAGSRWLYRDRPEQTAIERWRCMVEAAVFFRRLLEAPIPRVAVENPQMHQLGRDIVGRRPDQYVQPWEYGHTETKKTGLWLRGLPPLMVTDDAGQVAHALPIAQRQRVLYEAPDAERWKRRSTTFTGIGDAMADQWGAS